MKRRHPGHEPSLQVHNHLGLTGVALGAVLQNFLLPGKTSIPAVSHGAASCSFDLEPLSTPSVAHEIMELGSFILISYTYFLFKFYTIFWSYSFPSLNFSQILLTYSTSWSFPLKKIDNQTKQQQINKTGKSKQTQNEKKYQNKTKSTQQNIEYILWQTTSTGPGSALEYASYAEWHSMGGN